MNALFAAALAVALPQADTDTWTRFRGPNGAGVLTEGALPARLDPETNLRWRTPLAPGHSSPVLFEGRIYLTALEGDALRTLCFDADSGALEWHRTAPRPRAVQVDGRNHPASPTPAVGPEGVFVFFPDFGLLAYDHHAEELWRTPLGPFDNVYGMGASPILHGGLVVLACDQSLGSFLVALDAATGEERWRAERPAAKSGHCTPIVRAREGRSEAAELLLPGSFTLDAYDPRTGERRWSAGGLSFEMKSVPVLWDDLVFTNGYGSPLNQPGNQVQVPDWGAVLAERDADDSGGIGPAEMPAGRATAWFEFVDLDRSGALDKAEWGFLEDALASLNGLIAFRIDPATGAAAPEPAWSYRRSVPQLPSPVILDDVLYMLNDAGGILVTFHPRSGEVLEKGRLEDANDTFYASPVAGDGKVYFVSEHGLVVVLPAGGAIGEPLYAGDLGENVYATPALAPGRVILRTTEALYCFEDRLVGASAGATAGATAGDR